MCNGTTHQIAAAAVVGIGCLVAESGQRRETEKPFIGAILAAGFTKLPDILEPATHPNHRHFSWRRLCRDAGGGHAQGVLLEAGQSNGRDC